MIQKSADILQWLKNGKALVTAYVAEFKPKISTLNTPRAFDTFQILLTGFDVLLDFIQSLFTESMDSNDTLETTDVLIVGCGPTGALLTVLLGQFGVQNIVLEREPDVTEDPRGITLDEDGIRLLQEVGLYDKVYTEMGSCELWLS